MHFETIELMIKREACDFFIYGPKEECREFAKKLIKIKDESGEKIFWKMEKSNYVPIKMMSEGRPSKKEPEYEEWIAPWLRRMHRDKTRETYYIYEREFKERKEKLLNECIDTLKNEYKEVDMFSDIDTAEARGIQRAINLLIHKKHEIKRREIKDFDWWKHERRRQNLHIKNANKNPKKTISNIQKNEWIIRRKIKWNSR